jgi:molybdate transport system ATP-binding protein
LSEEQPEVQAPFAYLDFAMRHSIGPLKLDATFQLTQPWSLLFAPSGAGKTTILRAIAGLLRPQEARIVSRGQNIPKTGGTPTEHVLTDTAQRFFKPPHQRSIRMVSQDAALFPHMSVLQNVRYGVDNLSRTADPREHETESVSQLLKLCRIEHLTAKKPSQLSGGERQRVALARSLAVPGCNLLLLDEPFTGVDAILRNELIADLRVWLAHRNIPVFSVTHDIAEAFQLSAEILKLHNGRILQQGPAAEVLAQERSELIVQLGGTVPKGWT